MKQTVTKLNECLISAGGDVSVCMCVNLKGWFMALHPLSGHKPEPQVAPYERQLSIHPTNTDFPVNKFLLSHIHAG